MSRSARAFAELAFGNSYPLESSIVRRAEKELASGIRVSVIAYLNPERYELGFWKARRKNAAITVEYFSTVADISKRIEELGA